uniref:Arginyl-tRNA synthetase n=1 Tax=Parastrongyloides trichosuri TaxID=131310 RepID=A0A0N4ZH60_PARTI
MYKVLNNIYKTPNVVSKILSREVVKKKKIVIDFSSPNIAKRFHIGNLRSTLIGDYIKNINQLSHNEVISINYLGDWGTQFGIILLPFMKDKELIFKYENFTNEVDKMKFITDLYVEYNKVIQEDEEKRNEGKKIFENLEKYYKGEFKVNSDIEYQLKIIDIIRKSSIEYLEEFYNKMNISFNYWAGESNIIGEAHKIVEELRRRNEIETTKDGLSIVRYPDSNNYGCVMKSDGSSLYLTRDIAEVLRRDKLFNGDNYYYVVDRSQISHFECLKMILCKLGREDLSDKVKHIYFGRVKGLSTRNGRTKAVDDIIMEGEKLSLKYVKSSPTIKVDKESDLLEISNNLAVSTIKINEYQRKITSEYEFSFKDAFKEKGRNALLFQLNFGLFIYALNFISWSYSLIKFEAFADKGINLHFYPGPYINVLWNFVCWLFLTAIWVVILHRNKLPKYIENYVKTIEQYLFKRYSNEECLLEEASNDEENEEDSTKERLSTYETAWRLIKYCNKFKFWFTLGFLFLIIYSVARIFMPYFTGTLIADIVNGSGTQAIVKSIAYVGFVSVIASLFGGLRGGTFDWSTALIQKQVRDDLFRSLVSQEIAFFDDAQTGEVASRLTSDCEVMSSVISTNFNVFLRSGVMMIGSFIFMFVMSWRLTLVTFILIPLVGFVSKVYGAYYDKLSEECQNTIADGNKKAEEVLSTMRTVRSFACENIESNKFEFHLLKTLGILRKRAWGYFGYTVITEMCENVMLIGILSFGGYLCVTKSMTTDDLIKFLLYQMQLGENFYNLGWVFTNLMQAVGSSRKVFDYILRKPLIKYDGTLKPTVKGDIKISNVTFSYPSRPNQMILSNFSLHIKPGETVALVGSSGNGKSTIVSLIQRFYLPNSGEILLDDINIDNISHEYYHQKIALVAQEPILYSGSVRDNILYGYDNGTEEEMLEASKLANCHDFIMEMIDGYNTSCGEKGVKMSGGQKQRIAIARALVRKPVVLILDEATSALDAESEHKIQEALDKCSKNITIIKIAHRLNSVEKANRICVVNKGEIIQEGSHTQLMENKDGMYYNLVQKQLLSFNNDEEISKEKASSLPKSSISVSPTTEGRESLANRLSKSP